MRKTTRLLVLAMLCAQGVSAQEYDLSKIEEKVQKVAGNIYMLEGVNGFGGGNIGVSVGDDGIVLIDDQFAPLAPKIEAALKGITDKPVKLVINTHWHGDHTHGNVHFGQKSVVIAHDNVRTRMAMPGAMPTKDAGPLPRHALPVITFDHGLTVHLNGEEVRVIHAPAAHTDGDAIVWFTKSNVVHMGDTFFSGMFPFIDLESGGSIKGYLAAAQKVLGEVKADTKVIAGHGPLGTRTDLEKFVAMLQGSSAAVEKALRAGKSVEQMRKDKLLTQWDSWGKGFVKSDVMLDQLVAALKGEKKNPPWDK